MFIKENSVEFRCRRCHAEYEYNICPKCGCEGYIATEYTRIYEVTRKFLFWEKRRLVSEVRISEKDHDPNGPAKRIHIPLQKYTEVF